MVLFVVCVCASGTCEFWVVIIQAQDTKPEPRIGFISALKLPFILF